MKAKELIHQMKWRYAAKRMNGQKVPEAKLDNILEAIRLSASSFGLQPYKVVVIENPELRDKIQLVAHNQPQIHEASHILVFAAWKDIDEPAVDKFISNVSKIRELPVESLQGYKNAILRKVVANTPEENFNWASRQAYLALGTGLVAAAVEQVDATPMEGFDAIALDELLGLQKKGLRSVAILALGYRDENKDQLSQLPKVRWDKETLFMKVA